jgi:hypothetical protein
MVSPLDTLVEATEAVEPGLNVGDFVQEPVAESVDPEGNVIASKPGMIVTDLDSAGWTILYDTISGEPSVVNNNAVSTQLRYKRPGESKPAFTRLKPKNEPWRGSIRCMLHAGRPDYEELRRRGITQKGCPKATIPNEYELQQHMKNKHGREWATLEEERERSERAEDRALQREIYQRLSANSAPGSPTLSPETIAKVVEEATTGSVTESAPSVTTTDTGDSASNVYTESSPTEEHARVSDGACSCGKSFTPGTRNTADHKLKIHITGINRAAAS